MAHPVRFPARGRHGEFQLTPGPVLRCTDQEPTEAILRSAIAKPGVLDAFRRALTAECGDVSRWSEAEVVARIARLLLAGRWHVAQVPGSDRRFLPGLANPRPEVRPEPRERKAKVVDQETYVLAVEIKTIGGTLLVNHPVRILDPDTGDVVVDDIDTDGKGVVRARVPEDKKYRIEILDEVWDDAEVAFESADGDAVLACRFIDEHGQPVANEGVEGKSGDHEFTLTTDADGRIESPAAPGHYRLTVRGQTCDAHTLSRADLYTTEAEASPAETDDADPIHYLFVLPATTDTDPDDDSDGHDHRLTRDFSDLDGDDLMGEVA